MILAFLICVVVFLIVAIISYYFNGRDEDGALMFCVIVVPLALLVGFLHVIAYLGEVLCPTYPKRRSS